MIEIRFIDDSELEDFVRADRYGFGIDDPTDSDNTATDWLRNSGAVAQSIAAFDHGQMVGTFSSYPLELTVPGGGHVPMAGTTWVTVQATHRRRGILTKMMETHLRQAIDQGKVIAGLWASEETIYGRYGYGVATQNRSITVPAAQVTVPPGPPEISCRTLDADDYQKLVPELYSVTLGAVPGAFVRSDAWWQHMHFSDPAHRRGEFGQKRVVAAFNGDTPVGYIVFRLAQGWENAVSTGRLRVLELGYTNDDVRRTLWHFACSVDLFRNVKAEIAVDDPILNEISHPRSVSTHLLDALWIRPLDVVSMLVARTYQGDGSIVIDVADDYLDRGGRFALTVVDGHLECEPTTKPVDVSMEIRTLGAIYLGGFSAFQLARSRQIEGDREAVVTLDRMFRTLRAPFIPDEF